MLSGSKCPRARSACLCACLLLIATSQVEAQFVAGQQFYNQQALSTINALGAYTQGYSGSGVTIGVVDSGVDPNHIAVSSALVAAMGWSRADSENVMVNNWVSRTGTSNFSSFINDLAAGAHLLWQVKRLDIGSPANCLAVFRANRETGALIALAFLLASWLG